MFRARWFNIELNIISAAIFKDFLRYCGYRFESSGCYDLIHFEIFITSEKDFQRISEFLIFLPD